MKLPILPLFLSLALIGCGPKASIKETNIAEIKGMHFVIKASDRLAYFDTIRDDKYASYENRPTSGSLLLRRYSVFIDKSAQSSDSILVIAHVESPVGQFYPGLYKGQEGLTPIRSEKIGSVTYEALTQPASLPIPVQKAMADEGLTPKNYYVMKKLGMTGGPGNRHILEIAYYESLDVSNTKLKDWTNGKPLSDSQELYLKEFEQRASQSFTLAE